MADNGFLFGYLLARRNAKPWRGRKRTRPKMPAGLWRWSALVVTTVGALLGAALAMSLDWTPLRWAVIGAITGFLVGIYTVETLYERRVAAQPNLGAPPERLGTDTKRSR